MYCSLPSPDATSRLPVPLDGAPHALLHEDLHQVRADNVLPELLRLQQLQALQRRARVGQVLEVGRPAPLLQVVEVGDEARVREQLARGQVVEVVGVAESLHELRGAGCQPAR